MSNGEHHLQNNIRLQLHPVQSNVNIEMQKQIINQPNT